MMDSAELWDLARVSPRLVTPTASCLAMKMAEEFPRDPAKMGQATLLGRLAAQLYLVSFDDGESNEERIMKFLDKMELLCRVSYDTPRPPPFLRLYKTAICASFLTGGPNYRAPARRRSPAAEISLRCFPPSAP